MNKFFDVTNSRYNKVFSVSPRGSLYQESTLCEELKTVTTGFNLCEEIFDNLTFCIDKSINVVQLQEFPGISLLDLWQISISLDPITIALLYRSPTSSLN